MTRLLICVNLAWSKSKPKDSFGQSSGCSNQINFAWGSTNFWMIHADAKRSTQGRFLVAQILFWKSCLHRTFNCCSKLLGSSYSPNRAITCSNRVSSFSVLLWWVFGKKSISISELSFFLNFRICLRCSFFLFSSSVFCICEISVLSSSYSPVLSNSWARSKCAGG